MRNFLLVFLMIISAQKVFSQDIIVFMNGEEQQVEIEEITPDIIKYKVANTPNSPVYSVLTKSIFMIKFKDGSRQVIYTEPPPVTDTIYLVKGMMPRREMNACSKGQYDAFQFHKRKAGNFMLGLLFGPLGIYGVAATNAAPPPPEAAEKKYMENPIYLDCYNKAARKNNLSHAIGGFITMSATVLILYTVVQ
jgi:hypothetical protein